MSFNGNGVFNRLYNWVQDAASGIYIKADRMDAEMDGFATGLTTCLTKDGQSVMEANLRMGGFRITGMANPVGDQDAATRKFVNDLMAGLTNVTVADTAPSSPAVGDMWFRSADPKRLFVWVQGTTTAEWVLSSPEQTPPVVIAATAPVTAADGSLWYDTTAPAGLFVRIAGAWVRLTGEPIPQQVPVGSFMWHTGRTAPTGYLIANGAAVTTANAALRNLYLADGSPYGLSGADPLLPNLTAAGRFIRASLGAGIGVQQADAFQNHGHRITRQQGGGSGGSGEWIGVNDVPGNTTRTNRVLEPVVVSGSGDAAPRVAQETRPVNITLLPCVKT